MRVLVTGAGGQLGSEVVDLCTAAGDEVVPCDRAALDVTDRDQVLGALAHVRPDLVVHCAAYTDVDACEGAPDRAWAVNAVGSRHVADGCARVGAFLVHVSTDYVFDGDRGGYTEDDVPDLVPGTMKQQRLLATAPKDVTEDDLEGIFRRSLHLW